MAAPETCLLFWCNISNFYPPGHAVSREQWPMEFQGGPGDYYRRKAGLVKSPHSHFVRRKLLPFWQKLRMPVFYFLPIGPQRTERPRLYHLGWRDDTAMFAFLGVSLVGVERIALFHCLAPVPDHLFAPL